MLVLCGEIPFVPYGTPGTDAVYDAAKPFLASYNTVLLANHGIMSVGSYILEAFARAEAAESYAKTCFHTTMLGGEEALSDDKLEELYVMRPQMNALNSIPKE